jgi:diguanylate cyclase (GGDEF)-like protein/PAS domain S-box-containing protein
MSDLAAPLNATGHDGGRASPEEPARVAGKSTTARAPWYVRPIRLIVICGIILVGVVIAATASLLSNLRDRDLAEKERALENLALVLAEQVDRSFQSIELIQTVVIERMRTLGIASAEDYERRMSGHDTHQRLKDAINALPYINVIVLTDAEGKLINFSRFWPVPSVTIPDQDPSEIFRSDPQLISFVGKPLRSPVTGNWVVSIARKLTGPNGEFLGVVQGAMELQYFEKNFGAIAIAPNSSIALFRRDGTLLVRYPRQETAIGQSFSQSTSMKLLAKSDHGTAREIGMIDGQERLISARSLAHYPVALVVTATVADALANWKRGAIAMTGAALLIGLVIGGIVVLSIWQVGRKLREQNLQRDTALNNMSQGLVMFDAASRLVVCNDRYRQMYDLPPDLAKPGCTVFDLLKYRAAHGTFSGDPEDYVRDLLATIAEGKMAKHVVETGDGRITTVVNQPMADGGWVATHEDVTEIKRREESFRLLFKGNPVPMWVYALDSRRFLAVNEAAIAHYGYSREQFLTMTAFDIRPPEERERLAQFIREPFKAQSGERIWLHQKADGTKIDVATYSRALNYEGHAACLVAAIDVTERKRAEDELRRTQSFLDAIIENVPIPIVVKDARECRYTLANRASEELFGVSRGEIIGKNARELYPKEQADAVIAHDNEALQSDRPLILDNGSLHTPHNGVRLISSKRVVIRNDEGNPQYLLGVLEDVTERKRAEQRIAHLAHYDTLTELPNRAAFNECFADTIKRAAATNERFTVLSIDLDRFKEANDVYGHSVGDALLREVARRLQAAAAGAFLARIGGDEFTLIVTDGAQPGAAMALAERLLAVFTDDFEVEGRRLQIGLSIGGAVYPTDGTDAKTLMINADSALYRVKAETRGSVLFFEPEMSARLGERRALQGDLRSAIARGELLLHYQPQVRMAGESIGFEALVRWQCPNRGMILPGVFIPLAEESGLITPIGEWVLREACREAASWPQPLTIAVNISPIQFQHSDLPRLVHSILLETGLAPARLELEVTEGVLINDFSRAVSILRRLKLLGVGIALDDFGTGYSSLSYLHSFPFDRIKIDRAFIGDLEHNRHSMAIVRAVIGLGHSLGVPILAEGVETEIQHAFLVQEGCDAMQGYLTGRPLPIADYAELVGRPAIIPQSYATAG